MERESEKVGQDEKQEKPNVKEATPENQPGSAGDVSTVAHPNVPTFLDGLLGEQGLSIVPVSLVFEITGSGVIPVAKAPATIHRGINPIWPLFTGHFRETGFASQVREAVSTVVGTLSARAGESLVVRVKSDLDMCAYHFMQAVARVTPDEFKLEASESDLKRLLRNTSVKGQTLFSFSESTFQKVKEPMSLLLERGKMGYVQFAGSQGSETITKVFVEGPVSLVTIKGGEGDTLFRGHTVVEIILNSAAFTQDMLRKNATGPKEQSHIASYLVKELRRLVGGPVEISFWQTIIKGLNAMTDAKVLEKVELMERILRVITVMNHLMPSTPEEWRREFYGLSASPRQEHPMIATKVEYYIFWLLKDVLFNQGDGLTDRRRRTYAAIKTLCLEWLYGSTFLEPTSTSKEKYDTLYSKEHLKNWPDMNDIVKKVNEDGGPRFSTSIIREEVEQLVVDKYLHREKKPQVSYGFIYAPISFEEQESGLVLPHPSEIVDPIFNGSNVEVINPFTGEREII